MYNIINFYEIDDAFEFTNASVVPYGSSMLVNDKDNTSTVLPVFLSSSLTKALGGIIFDDNTVYRIKFFKGVSSKGNKFISIKDVTRVTPVLPAEVEPSASKSVVSKVKHK
jgi:hypothetical protein